MNAHKRKHALFDRLARLGFTFGESATLRRIEMTLHRWAERECGDGSDWAIERDDATGKPFNVWHGDGARRKYAIADREAGAMRRLWKIISDRNTRNWIGTGVAMGASPNHVIAYHQGDCRGCMLYLVTIAQLTDETGFIAPVEQYYTQGLAVCA
jgi:hypothetical protein